MTTLLIKKTKTLSSTKPTIQKEILEEWEDIVEELNDPQTIKDIVQARKEFKKRDTVLYNELFKK